MTFGRIGRAGITALRRYPLLVGALYLVQLVASSLAGLVAARALAAELADYPIVDRAAAGDLSAALMIATELGTALSAALWSSLAFVIAYALLSWATTAGLIETLWCRPVSRRHTAETFGAGAAVNLFAFARLWLWCLLPYAVVAVAVLVGLTIGLADAIAIMTPGQLLAELAPALAPGLILWWMVNTAVDFARIDLVKRRRKSALRALLRGFADTFTSRWPLPHAAIFYLVFFGATYAYTRATLGLEMSAVAYFLIRQTLAITRFAAKVWLIGGQIELAAERRRPKNP